MQGYHGYAFLIYFILLCSCSSNVVMGDSDYMNKLIYLAELLEKEQAGTADYLAIKLNVSKRTVYRYLNELRENGAIIHYSKSKKGYILKNNFDLKEVFLQSALKWQH